MSAVHILEYAQMLLAQGPFSRKLLVNKNLGGELILLISGVWEAAKEDTRNEDSLQEEGMRIISDMLLVRCSIHPQKYNHRPGCSSMVECVLGMHETLGFIPSRYKDMDTDTHTHTHTKQNEQLLPSHANQYIYTYIYIHT